MMMFLDISISGNTEKNTIQNGRMMSIVIQILFTPIVGGSQSAKARLKEGELENGEQKMIFIIRNRRTNEVQYACELPSEVEDKDYSFHLGFAVKHAVKMNAVLAGADLAGANLYGADLAYAHLSGANLSGANLADADLTSAYLVHANLAGANLSGANLTGAHLTRANLDGADLDGALKPAVRSKRAAAEPIPE